MNRFDVRYMQLVEEKLLAITNKTTSVTDVAEELSVTRQTVICERPDCRVFVLLQERL